jgi:5-methylcytosine-specific restriction endonuclease McrA|tara:strand:+ start:3424 stop:4221 length:798 start_codon:yes stop_codon:yes gene_type:complete
VVVPKNWYNGINAMPRKHKNKSRRSKALRAGRGQRAESIPGIVGGIGPHAGAAALDYSNLLTGLDSKVLVLNKLYMAVRVITARRAFVLLSRDSAEVIHADDGSFANYNLSTWTELSELRREYEPDKHEWVKTVRFDIAVPRIIRLVGYDKLPKQRVKLNRRNLFARDHNRCQYCGKHFPTSELSIDHVLPRSQEGPDTWENLVCACVKCNSRKGGRTPDQAHMKLIKEPVRPKRNPLISMRLNHERYASWKAFLDEAYWSVELK